MDLEERGRRANLLPPVSLSQSLPFDIKAARAWGAFKEAAARRLSMTLPPCLELLAQLRAQTHSQSVLDFCCELSVVLDDFLLFIQGMLCRERMLGHVHASLR